jgi:hypothetical protein
MAIRARIGMAGESLLLRRRAPFTIGQDASSDTEGLFVALDGRQVTVSGRSWRLQVYGACDRGGRRWVQLGLTGQPHYMLTLRLAPGDDVGHAVQALSSWLANPADKGNILSYA